MLPVSSFWVKFSPGETNQNMATSLSHWSRLTQLMTIATESADQLTEDEIEVILDIWNRKPQIISWTQLIITGTITLACAVIPNV